MGTLVILIPPSVALIVFGIITEQSIGRLFLAGIVPGLLIALFFALTIWIWCADNPSLGPKGPGRAGGSASPICRKSCGCYWCSW